MALTATRGPRSTRIYRSNTPAGPLQLTLRKGSQNLMLDHGRVVLTADAEGRPFTLWRAQTLWRRGYDGRCQVISRGDEWQRRRAVLAGDEFLVEWRRAVSGLGDTLGAIEDTDDRARLASMLEPDELRLAAEAQRYRGLYRGLGILPPDAYLAAVVQLVEGCPYNRCTFCTFYRHRRYRIRRIDELERHARAVKAFLGRALEMRRSVFLADADALSAPDAVLLATLDRCRRIFDERPVDAFASSFTRKGRTVERYRALQRAGLRRVTLGMESGSPAVLERLGKPTSAAEILSVVERMKAAGLLVNLVLLVGAGGERLRAAHVDQTVALLSQMPLERRDRIFLSELVLAESAPLLGQEPQSAQLDAASLAAESASLRSALRQLDAHPQIARYDIREFHG